MSRGGAGKSQLTTPGYPSLWLPFHSSVNAPQPRPAAPFSQPCPLLPPSQWAPTSSCPWPQSANQLLGIQMFLRIYSAQTRPDLTLSW